MSTPDAARAPGIEGVPPSNEGKMPSIPALSALRSPPMPTFEEPWFAAQGDFTLPFDVNLGGSRRPVNNLWIPAKAGIHDLDNRRPALHLTP